MTHSRSGCGAAPALAARRWRAARAAAALLALLPTLAAAAGWSLMQGAQVHPPYQGSVPAGSDVVFSSRFTRPEAPAVVKAFGATRVEWVYSNDAAFIASLRAVAPWFGGAMNFAGPLPNDDGYARDFDGRIVGPPWQSGWGARWVTTTHPDARRVLDQQLARLLDLNIDSLQIDDAIAQLFPAIYQAGDFNPASLAGFQRFLADHPDQARLRALGLDPGRGDYRAYLKERHGVVDAADYQRRFRSFPSTPIWLQYMQRSVADHFERLRGQLRRQDRRAVALSINLSELVEPDERNVQFFLAPHIDYSMSESGIADPAQLASRAATTRALGLGFVPSIRPGSLRDNRHAIATLYALGGQPIVPWDVYEGNDAAGKARRYFGKPEELADLYRFVRAKPGLFDGHELAAEVGIVVPVHRFPTQAVRTLIRSLAERSIPFAYVLAGGTERRFRLDAARLRGYRMLLTLNPESDFSRDEIDALRQSGVPTQNASALRDADLSALQPFLIAPGAETTRVIPRADPRRPDRLLLHVIDAAQADPAAAGGACRRRIGIRHDVLPSGRQPALTWHGAGAEQTLSAEPTPQALYTTLPDCSLWGILELRWPPAELRP